MAEVNLVCKVAQLHADVSPTGSTSEDDDLFSPELLRNSVVVTMDHFAGELVKTRNVGDDWDRIVAITNHHRVKCFSVLLQCLKTLGCHLPLLGSLILCWLNFGHLGVELDELLQLKVRTVQLGSELVTQLRNIFTVY